MAVLLDLVSAGLKVGATGFGRLAMDVATVLEQRAGRDRGGRLVPIVLGGRCGTMRGRFT